MQERRLLAMGTRVHLLADGPDADAVADALAAAEHLVESLDRRWSRFRAGSDVDRINHAHGEPVVVGPDTYDVVRAACEAWEITGGRFDPTVLPALLAAGYDRDFDLVAPDSTVPPAPSGPSVGAGALVLDPVLHTVAVPPGVTLDLGGIGKGWAADAVSFELARRGVTSSCVNLGGDLRVAGPGPEQGGWWISLDEPAGTLVGLSDGAIATSSTAARRWVRDGHLQHHLIDPASGRPSDAGVRSVTVIAGTATQAEVWAKAALLAGPHGAVATLESQGLSGLVVADDGGVLPAGPIEGYLYR